MVGHPYYLKSKAIFLMSTHKDTNIYNAPGFYHLSSYHPFDLIHFSGIHSS